jgi:glycosyltransferase involved in cell wall biosynthesis
MLVRSAHRRRAATGSTPRTPTTTACGEFDAASDTLRIYSDPTAAFAHTRLLVRRGQQVLGYVHLDTPPQRLTTDAVRNAAAGYLAAAIDPAAAGHAADHGAADPGAAGAGPSDAAAQPSVTVAICTRDRPESLGRCLASLADVRHPGLDILVVDNAPTDERTRELVERIAAADPRVRYVREPRGGLSHARNTALRVGRGDVIAFSDDDVRFSPEWITALVEPFAGRPHVGCVTGLVATAQLRTAFDTYFEQRYASWSSRTEPEVHRPGARAGDPLYPFASGRFGTGANFALDRRAARNSGGFDPALGAGSPAAGGEDLDVFARMVLAGYELHYRPAAIVWHTHRTERAAQLRQSLHYGSGCSAYVTKMLLSRATRARMVRALPRGGVHVLRTAAGLQPPERRLERRLAFGAFFACEVLGYVIGPVAYFLGRRRDVARPSRPWSTRRSS